MVSGRTKSPLTRLVILFAVLSTAYATTHMHAEQPPCGKKSCNTAPRYGGKNGMVRPEFYTEYQNTWYGSPYGGGYWGPGSFNANPLNANYQGYPL